MDQLELSKIYAKLITSSSPSKNEALRLCGLIMAEIAIDNENIKVTKTTIETKDTIKEKYRFDKIKPEEPKKSKPEGKVLMHQADKCFCSSCKEASYRVVKPVYEKGMSTQDFIEAYEPLGTATSLDETFLDNVLIADNGNFLIDCTLCGGDKTLVLIKRDETAKITPTKAKSSAVASFSGDGLK